MGVQGILARNQTVGKWGEQVAADYLVSQGYDLVARNIRTPYGEIDLVVAAPNLTVFVEVKARLSSTMGPPEISVGPRKQGHMIACAQHYAQQHAVDHWRIDVVTVERVSGQPRITHFENAVS